VYIYTVVKINNHNNKRHTLTAETVGWLAGWLHHLARRRPSTL
jgi:hypothetical protein